MVAKQGPALVWVWADVACGGVAGFKTHVAVALSNMTIMAGALVNLGFNLTKKHPHLDRPLIDWDLILIMEPTTILGALAGSYLNKVKPTLISGKKSRGEKRERKIEKMQSRLRSTGSAVAVEPARRVRAPGS